ncbi:RNA polymerase sigma factor [Planobispora longispora]|uniref:RNA polymerase sigma-70 region 2 domain-containing protein n=1 Tax=Planobispora longispora TaxID=28887 RepID=A0A8J3W2I2_9ACTN|nr:sigma factor [Planobispora longispora]GIH73802.1 hypothetical protein Plo01_02310 [Planobispora longispora]
MYRFLARRREPPPITPDSGDADLLLAVAAERVEALKILHRRHAPRLRVRLARRCADPDLVDDAIQDASVAVWRDAHRYRAVDGRSPGAGRRRGPGRPPTARAGGAGKETHVTFTRVTLRGAVPS